MAHPPGVVTYHGYVSPLNLASSSSCLNVFYESSYWSELTSRPELDIWCIALTLLSLLLRLRYPLGPHHTHHSIMRSRALDRLQELDELYPPKTPWINMPDSHHLTQKAREHETKEWKRVRKALWDFLEIDGKRRIRRFGGYQIGEKVSKRVEDFDVDGEVEGMKSTSFIPTEVKYTLPLYVPPFEPDAISNSDIDSTSGALVLDNPTNMKERKVLSYIRYLLRSAGIGYHCLQHVVASDSPGYIYQLVLPYPQVTTISQIPSRDEAQQQQQGQPQATATGTGWVASLNPFRKNNRSTSVPTQPKSRSQSRSKSRSRSRSKSRNHDRNASPQTKPTSRSKSKSNPKVNNNNANANSNGKKRFLRTWIRITFEEISLSPTSASHEVFPVTSRSSSRTRVDGLSPMISASNNLALAQAQIPMPVPLGLDLNALSFSPTYTNRRPSQSPRRKTSDRIPVRPSPLSRQVSPEPERRTSHPHQTQMNDQNQIQHREDVQERILSRASSSAASNRTRVNTRSRILITSSDTRGYPALRRALDIKYEHIKNESDSEYPLSPVVIQKPLPAEMGIEPEEERGRPRSKESQKSLVMLEAFQRNTNINETNVMSKDVNEVGVEPVEERKGSRNRKIKSKTGFWSLFAGDNNGHVHGGNHRSFSLPPSRDSLV